MSCLLFAYANLIFLSNDAHVRWFIKNEPFLQVKTRGNGRSCSDAWNYTVSLRNVNKAWGISRVFFPVKTGENATRCGLIFFPF
jgi:hypothetical protein